MGKFAQRAIVAIAAATLAAGGSLMLGGTAFATGETNNHGGAGGSGGSGTAKCGVPVAVSLGVIGEGGDVSQCNGSGGNGGGGGNATDY